MSMLRRLGISCREFLGNIVRQRHHTELATAPLFTPQYIESPDLIFDRDRETTHSALCLPRQTDMEPARNRVVGTDDAVQLGNPLFLQSIERTTNFDITDVLVGAFLGMVYIPSGMHDVLGLGGSITYTD